VKIHLAANAKKEQKNAYSPLAGSICHSPRYSLPRQLTTLHFWQYILHSCPLSLNLFTPTRRRLGQLTSRDSRAMYATRTDQLQLAKALLPKYAAFSQLGDQSPNLPDVHIFNAKIWWSFTTLN
jgi:hypothetical protein